MCCVSLASLAEDAEDAVSWGDAHNWFHCEYSRFDDEKAKGSKCIVGIVQRFDCEYNSGIEMQSCRTIRLLHKTWAFC